MSSNDGSPNAAGVARRAGALAKASLSPLAPLFLVSLIIPLYFYIGPARLSAYRVLLLLALAPTIVMWISGRAGPKRRADTLMLAFAAWSMISMLVIHGVEQIQFATMFVIETLGAYFLGRTLVRGPEHLRAVLMTVFLIVLFLAPIAWFESMTGRPLLIELAGKIGPTVPNVNIGGRMGLWRAQGPFDHPILYGVFCASAMGLTLYALSRQGPARGMAILGALLVPVAAFPSLSSGAYLTMIFQVFLVVYEFATRRVPHRWRLLLIGFLIVYVTIDMLSNRSPVPVFIQYFTFCGDCAYNRVLIWEYGTAEVWRHPLFGIGLNEWVRAPWMSTSMDNFWLVYAVRHGLPAFLFLGGAVVWAMWAVGKAPLADRSLDAIRKGWLISVGGMCLALCTVHLWNAPYVYFLFLVGAGMWLLDAPSGDAAEPTPREWPERSPLRPVIGALGEVGPPRPVAIR